MPQYNQININAHAPYIDNEKAVWKLSCNKLDIIFVDKCM